MRVFIIACGLCILFSNNLAAETDVDSIQYTWASRALVQRTAMFCNLLHSYLSVNAKMPQNLDSLKSFSACSIYEFDTTGIGSYFSEDSTKAVFEYNFYSISGTKLNDSVTMYELSVEFTWDDPLSFSSHNSNNYCRIKKGLFKCGGKEYKLKEHDVLNYQDFFKTVPLKVKHISVENPYKIGTPEYEVMRCFELLRNSEMTEYFNRMDPEQLTAIKNAFRRLFTGDYPVNELIETFGFSKLEIYDSLSAGDILKRVLSQAMTNMSGDMFLTGKDELQILGSVPDGSRVVVLTKQTIRVLGQTLQTTENISVVSRNGKWFIQLNEDMDTKLTELVDSLIESTKDHPVPKLLPALPERIEEDPKDKN